MQVYRCRLGESNPRGEKAEWTPFHYHWIGPDELEQYAFPNVFVRIIKAWLQSKNELF
jgi:A/G-specific adenine glycosylase